jgi:hypothetical protein
MLSQQWQYQIRIDLADDVAEIARRDPSNPAIEPLQQILGKHRATMKCQFDAFAEYVTEAEKHGTETYPLYEWTKATSEDPSKKKKHLSSFALYVEGKEVYAGEKAESLEEDLWPMMGDKLVKRISKYDTNPANNPQPPPRYRK